MKVLWFINTPSSYAEKINSVGVGGSWISSLEENFRNKFSGELRLAFHLGDEFKKDYFNEFYYYLIPEFKSNNRLNRITRKWKKIYFDKNFIVEQYLKVIEDFEPDLIQIFGSEKPFGLVIPYITQPVILHIQGNLNVIKKKHFSGFSLKEIKKVTSLKEHFKHSGPFYNIERYHEAIRIEEEIYKHCKYFFGRTEWDKRVSKILSPKSTYYHCDEIMRNEFYNNNWNNDYKLSEKFCITSVFRDSSYKGIETIYESMDLLTKSKNVNIEWRVIGVKPSSRFIKIIRNKLKSGFNRLSIKLLGDKNSQEIVDILKTSHLFVHPSHIENGCNSISEAMLLGIPVLATAVGGVPTTIEDNRTGYLVQEGEPFAMSGAILSIIEHYNEAIKIGEEGRNIAKLRHDKDIIFKTVLETYHKILDENV